MHDLGAFFGGLGTAGFIFFLILFILGLVKKKKIKRRLTFLMIFSVLMVGGILITNYTEEKIDVNWYVEYEKQLNKDFSDKETGGEAGIIRIEIKEGKIINVVLDPQIMAKEGITQKDYESYARVWAIKLSDEKQKRKIGSEATSYIILNNEVMATISYSKSRNFITERILIIRIEN